MKRPSEKPEVCEECEQPGDLQWNEDFQKWLCEFCEELLMEEEWEGMVEQRESSKYSNCGMNWDKESKQNKKYDGNRQKYKIQRKDKQNEF